MKSFLLLVLLAGSPRPCCPAAKTQEAAGAAHHAHAPAQPSTALSISVGEKHVVLSPTDLQALSQASVTVLNAHTKTEETYTGPLVSDVLAKAGVAFSGATERDILRSYCCSHRHRWLLRGVFRSGVAEHPSQDAMYCGAHQGWTAAD